MTVVAWVVVGLCAAWLLALTVAWFRVWETRIRAELEDELLEERR